MKKYKLIAVLAASMAFTTGCYDLDVLAAVTTQLHMPPSQEVPILVAKDLLQTNSRNFMKEFLAPTSSYRM